MCLYPRLLKNKKYVPTKKNNYNPPKLQDKRVEYVAIGCGQCIECRKQKSRAWQIRLNEELQEHKYNYFVTLTFSEENLNILCSEIGMTECNAVATIAMRRFLERWRKKYKKSIKHWFVTELGHVNTERIHLHGIIFSEIEIKNETLQQLWKYGITDIGQYCNEKTINYITKYLHKIDNEHKGYVPINLCSAGIGANYLKKGIIYNKYQGKETNTLYRFKNGQKSNLPIYYRNHIYTEEEREKLWVQQIEKQEIYVRGIKIDLTKKNAYEEYEKVLETQQKDNIALGYGDLSKEWQKKDYNVTLHMINAKQKLQNYHKNNINIS